MRTVSTFICILHSMLAASQTDTAKNCFSWTKLHCFQVMVLRDTSPIIKQGFMDLKDVLRSVDGHIRKQA